MNLVYDPPGGETIDTAFEKAHRMAWTAKQSVSFTFNGESLTVKPDDLPWRLADQWRKNMEERRREYANSPEGRAAAAARAAEAERLTKIAADLLHDAAPNLTTLPVAVGLCAAWADCGHIDARIPWSEYAESLRAAGYIEGDGVGRTDLEHAPVAFGRYIVGQAIACMERGMPPHPIVSVFAERWRALLGSS